MESDVRIICFPHAGGSASYYFPLSQALASGIEVLAVQYPGRQDRRAERCLDNISELAERIFDIHPVWSGRPFAFFGHSMGAVLAFELARRLQERTGTTPLRLFASGRPAPSRSRYNNIHLRDDPGLVAELRRVGGTEHVLLADQQLLAAILPPTRSDYKAIETYRYLPGPPLGCPITALVGDQDPQTSIDDASAWRDHTSAEFDLRVYPGGHFYLQDCRAAVAQTISSTLDKCTSRSNGAVRDGQRYGT
jgi:pyochelin biosynthesis protein PchC